MGSSISFYCSSSDYEALVEHAESIGLVLTSTMVDKPLNKDPQFGPYCFLSVIPESKLHPYGSPPVKISDATDPVIGFMRPYYKKPYLVAGHIHWSDDVPHLAAQTKPYYQRMVKWIGKEWEKLPGGGFYIGPEAKSLAESGAQMVNVLPGQATVRIVEVE